MPETEAGIVIEDVIGDDMLYGASAIAAFLGMKRAAVYYLSSEANSNERLPVFRIGAQLCARRSTLSGWIAERERAARAR